MNALSKTVMAHFADFVRVKYKNRFVSEHSMHSLYQRFEAISLAVVRQCLPHGVFQLHLLSLGECAEKAGWCAAWRRPRIVMSLHHLSYLCYLSFEQGARNHVELNLVL